MSELKWFVAHTRPRCEKKLADYCQREGIPVTLPCYAAAHKYRGKTVRFRKPLFPGYVFLHIEPRRRQTAYQSAYVANFLSVPDQDEFERQLQDIVRALETDLVIRLAPEIGPGQRVVIKAGPLRGMDGCVEQRYGMSTVLLRLDFIGQAAAVTVEAWQLEPA